MLLVYTDESGINYQRKKKSFVDGPFIVWGGLLIPEEKYFQLERLFYDLIKKELGITNWEDIEIHATDIWLQRGDFKTLSDKKARRYFEELIQLLVKLDIKIVAGVKKKSLGLRSKISKDKEVGMAIYAFLTGLEHSLSKKNETAILIADASSDETNLSSLEKLYFEKTKWRYNPGAKKTTIIKSKFFFESLSCFLLDQVHYVDSSRSLFVQISDNATYVIRRVFEHSFYRHNGKLGIVADENKVPITSQDFRWLSKNILLCMFDEDKNDVMMDTLDGFNLEQNSYLNIQTINSIP